MSRLKHKENEIEIGGKLIKFPNQTIRLAEQIRDITVIIFQGDYPPQDKFYNNVIALNSSDGTKLWEVETDEELDFQNPYENVVDSGAYLTLFKAKSHYVPIDKNSGKILRNIDLMQGKRPW